MIDDQLTDEDLLASGEPEHFGCFYQRHVREVLGYMMRRTGDAEAAADLTAETFAAAIVARRRFRPGVAPAGAWLLTIAHRKLVDYQRRGFAEQRARRRRLRLERSRGTRCAAPCRRTQQPPVFVSLQIASLLRVRG